MGSGLGSIFGGVRPYLSFVTSSGLADHLTRFSHCRSSLSFPAGGTSSFIRVNGRFWSKNGIATSSDEAHKLASCPYSSSSDITAGIAVIPCVAGWFVCPPEVLDPKRDKRIDYFGAFLSTAGLVLLTFALSSGQTAPNQWKTGCECHNDLGRLFSFA